eukprot:52530_1
MLTSKDKRGKLLTLRSRYPCVSLLCWSALLCIPLLLFVIINTTTKCPTPYIDEPITDPSIPPWILKHTKPVSKLITKGDPNYDPVKHATIFVAIAAYRDPECRNTVLQVFEHARHPNRLHIGIFTQNDVNVDDDCADFRDVLNCDTQHNHRDKYKYIFAQDNDDPLAGQNLTQEERTKAERKRAKNAWKQRYKDTPHVLCGRLHQIRTKRVDWRDGLGPTYGRYRAELFYDNEEYYLQMDSHTAFARDWDVILIKMHLQLNNDYGVISTYPKPLSSPTLWHWTPLQASYTKDIYVICKTGVLVDKLTKSFKLNPANIIKNPGRPILTAFFAAGFSFQRGHRIVNVPYDPYAAFVFDGEEMSMAVRMWTNGYDFYAPNADVAYHLYSPNDAKIRPVFWESDDWTKKKQWKITRYSEFRLNYIMGLHDLLHNFIPLTSVDLRDIEVYGIGDKRDVFDFWKFTRIDIHNLTKLSYDLCPIYKEGGMHPYRIPWKNKTEDPYGMVLDKY